MGMSEAAGDHVTLFSSWIPKRIICPNTSSLITALSKGRTLLGDCEFPLCASRRPGRSPVCFHSPGWVSQPHHAF